MVDWAAGLFTRFGTLRGIFVGTADKIRAKRKPMGRTDLCRNVQQQQKNATRTNQSGNRPCGEKKPNQIRDSTPVWHPGGVLLFGRELFLQSTKQVVGHVGMTVMIGQKNIPQTSLKHPLNIPIHYYNPLTRTRTSRAL